jgi:hypothetical protein
MAPSFELQLGKISAEVVPDVLETGRRRRGRAPGYIVDVSLGQNCGLTCGLVESEAMFSDLPVERRVATWVRRADTAVGPPYFLDVIPKA